MVAASLQLASSTPTGRQRDSQNFPDISIFLVNLPKKKKKNSLPNIQNNYKTVLEHVINYRKVIDGKFRL